MSFNPGATNYHLGIRQAAIDKTTDADLGRLKRERQDRIRKSGERCDLQKLISAGARGLAAVYTGGLSETMGGGDIIDQALLGTDSEGRAVRNEYGNLVKAGANIYQGGMAQKDAKLAKQDAKFDKLRSKRMDIVNQLFDAGMPKEAMKAQREIENMEGDYATKRKGMEGGWNPFAHSDKDYNELQPQQMSRGDRATERMRQHGKWDYEMGEGNQSTAELKEQYGQYGAGQQQQTEPSSQSGGGLPPPASAQKAPSLADMEARRLEKIKADREKLKGIGPQ